MHALSSQKTALQAERSCFPFISLCIVIVSSKRTKKENKVPWGCQSHWTIWAGNAKTNIVSSTRHIYGMLLWRYYMHAFELSQLLSMSERSGIGYTEFLRHPSLSVGLYTLPAGSVDPQQPHTEDEVYYIVSGQGVIQVGDETRAVQEGSVIF